MKKILLSICISFIIGTNVLLAQNMLDSVFIEKHTLTAAELTLTGAPAGSVTYRVFVDMKPGKKLVMVGGNTNHPLTFSTTTSFYNDGYGMTVGNDNRPYSSTVTTPVQVAPITKFNTYVTLGGISKKTGTGANLTSARIGVPTSENVAGFVDGTPASVSFIGIDASTVDAGLNGGSILTTNNGYYFILGGTSGSAGTNSILIGQFTTDGEFKYEFLLQLTDGPLSEKYVSGGTVVTLTGNPSGEYVNPTLSGPYINVPPSILIAIPTSVNENDTVAFNATAMDDSKVTNVEFFVDGTSIGSTTSSPYSIKWIAKTIGNHIVTAKATDNMNISTTSLESTINVKIRPYLALSSSSKEIAKEGTATTVTISSNTSWTATTTNNWLTVTPASGTNDGSISISASANNDSARTGTVTISAKGVPDQIITVIQADGTELSVLSAIANIKADGTAISIDVTSNTSWIATSTDSWVAISPSIATNGNGKLTISASANTGIAKNATITIKTIGLASQSITVNQADGTPSLSTSTDSVTLVKEGTATNVSVISKNTSWAATSADSWITFTPSTATIGDGTLSISAVANTGVERIGTIIISASGLTNKTITVKQADGSSVTNTLTVSSNNVSLTTEGTAISVDVTSNTSWNASTTNSWITVTPLTGTNTGTISISASANTDVQRTGSVTVSANGATSQTITIVQAELLPTVTVSSLDVSLAKDLNSNSTIDITTNTSWIASSNQTWLTITPISGTNNGTITVSATANTGIARSATISLTIGTGANAISKSITVIQATGIIPALSTSVDSVLIVKEGTASNILISSNTTWTASVKSQWLTITPTSGSNDGTITISALPNKSAVRIDTITIIGVGVANKTVIVKQADGTPSLSVSNNTISLTKDGTAVTIDIKSANTKWKAKTNDSWIIISPADSTIGNAKLSISATQNIDIEKTGTITISASGVPDQIITVTQASGFVPTLTVSSTTDTLVKEGKAKSITVTSNTIWTASTTDSWLTITPTSGTASGSISITASANTGNQRTGSITVTASGITKTITIIQDGATAISELDSKSVKVSPNPAKSFITCGVDEKTIVSIYSLLGELVLTTTISSNETIAIESLQAGVYIVKLSTATTDYFEKIIKE